MQAGDQMLERELAGRRGPPVGTGPHVRASRPLQARCLTDFQPLSRPCSQEELAAIATRVGPIR
jgi:hypothetical protein